MIKRPFLATAILAILAAMAVLPAHAEQPSNACIGMAGDSNVFGHVTFQIPNGNVGIVYIQPLWVVLQQRLHNAGIDDLKVLDRSLVASGITFTGRTAYLKSSPYGSLIADRCKFVVVLPFIPDVSSGTSTPEQYIGQMQKLIGGLLDQNPDGTIIILDYYQVTPSPFTADNIGLRLTPDRIATFNSKIKDSCRSDGSLGQYKQVICLQTQPFFKDMDTPYVLGETTHDQYNALFYHTTGFTPEVEVYFAANPDGRLIGDGIHLSLSGRTRLAEALTDQIVTVINANRRKPVPTGAGS